MPEISAPTATIIAQFLAMFAAVAVAGLTAILTYRTTKRREHEAEIRKEKLEHYKDWTASMSGVLSGQVTQAGQKAFAQASNNLLLIAPPKVIVALQALQSAIKTGRTQPLSTREHDELLSALFHAMRKDLGLHENGKGDSLVFGLWSAGGSTS